VADLISAAGQISVKKIENIGVGFNNMISVSLYHTQHRVFTAWS